MRRIGVVWKVLAAALYLGQAAQAADLTVGGDAAMRCTATLTGVIAAEDVALFRAFRKERDWGNAYYGGMDRLCLDSPGGNYLAALEIAQEINSAGIGTAIAAGVRCESACAMIFMGGKRNGEAKNFWSDRVLHPKGRLGFHAPRLAIGDAEYNKDDVDRAYEIALRSIGALQGVKLLAGFDFADSLLVEMLNVPKDEMLYIETVADAAKWRIEVGPVGLPGGETAAMARHACFNAQVMNFEFFSGFFDEMVPQPSLQRSAGDFHMFRSQGGYLVDGGWDCVVSFDLEAAGLPVGDRRLRWEVIFDPGSPEFIERETLWPFMMHAPTTRLTDLP